MCCEKYSVPCQARLWTKYIFDEKDVVGKMSICIKYRSKYRGSLKVAMSGQNSLPQTTKLCNILQADPKTHLQLLKKSLLYDHYYRLDKKDLQISAGFCVTSYFETTKEQEVSNVTKVGANTVKHRSSFPLVQYYRVRNFVEWGLFHNIF